MALFTNIKMKRKAKNEKKLLAEKWNKLCEMWSNGTLCTPYNELFSYDSNIQGEGHLCFFDNNKENLNDLIKILLENLLAKLSTNLKEAFELYKTSKYTEDSFTKYDNFYYENEELLIYILEDYSKEL